jgi:Tol biopolymer transport system component
MRRQLAMVLLLLAAAAGAVGAGDYKVTRVDVGSKCKWSPDGKYLSYLKGNSETKGNELWVYVVDSGLTRKVGPAASIYYEWLGPDKLIVETQVWSGQGGQRVITEGYQVLSLSGREETLYSATGPKDTFVRSRLQRLNTGQVIIAREEMDDISKVRQLMKASDIDTATYFVVSNSDYWFTMYWGMERDTDVWLIRPDGRPLKRVTTGKTWYFPQLSPDGRYIACDAGRGLVVLDLDGNIVGKVDTAEALSWLPDSKRLLYEKIEEGCEDDLLAADILAADIYVADLTGENEIQITSTSDKLECDPAVSPDMTKIAYFDHSSHYIEIIDVEGVLK